MPGPAPKHGGRRQRKTNQVIPFIPAAVQKKDPPPPPKGLLKCTKQSWVKRWNSPLAKFWERETDLEVLERLHHLEDERERAKRGLRKQGRLIEGSMGQQVLNPLYRLIGALDAEIRQLEDRLGLTPRARLQLGITFGEAVKSIEELNRFLDQDGEETEEDDPRA